MAPDTKIFYGLASPAAAGTMSTLVWIWVDNFPPMQSVEVSVLVAIFTTVVAFLMVSNVKYFSPKNIKGRVPFPIMLVAVLLFIVVAVYPPGMLFCVGLAYGLSGPIQALMRLVRGKDNASEV
jgi:CDP-diacylglycerol--serine O-phosphatidyltransferase